MDALQVLKTRRSIRAYQPTAIAREVLLDLVECARQAPTAMNVQPWAFVVLTDAAQRAKLVTLLGHAAFIGTAGACIAVFCKETAYYVEDGSAATQNLLLAAAAHGLGSCWVGGDKTPYADTVRQFFGAPAGYKLVSLVAVGVAAETPAPEKRPLTELLHWEKW